MIETLGNLIRGRVVSAQAQAQEPTTDLVRPKSNTDGDDLHSTCQLGPHLATINPIPPIDLQFDL